MSDDITAQRTALADFGLFAFRCRDIDALLTRATELVSEALRLDLVKVLEHRPGQGEFLLRAGVNWEPGVVGDVTFADHENSPAGYALLTGEPVVSHNVAAETRFRTPDVLARHGVSSMVNVIIAGDGEPFGVLEVDAREPRDFGDDDIAFLRLYANLLAAAIERLRRHEELKQQAREQSVLAGELGHRVANLLSLVRALASQTAVENRSATAFRDEFLGRLHALSVAEHLVFDDSGETVDLHRLAGDIVAPHQGGRAKSIVIDGASARLSPLQGRMLGLALHELATNAAKYGALSVPEGHVELKWRIEAEAGQTQLSVRWQEFGGPPVAPPDRQGLGSRLLEEGVGAQLSGKANLDYRDGGLVYQFAFPLR